MHSTPATVNASSLLQRVGENALSFADRLANNFHPVEGTS
jgi:hypothetical protein